MPHNDIIVITSYICFLKDIFFKLCQDFAVMEGSVNFAQVRSSTINTCSQLRTAFADGESFPQTSSQVREILYPFTMLNLKKNKTRVRTYNVPLFQINYQFYSFDVSTRFFRSRVSLNFDRNHIGIFYPRKTQMTFKLIFLKI